VESTFNELCAKDEEYDCKKENVWKIVYPKDKEEL